MDETSKKAREYSRCKTQLVFYQLLLILIFLTGILFSGISLRLRRLVTGWTDNFHLQVGLYLAVFSAVYYLVFVWIDFYAGFILEHKFNLSNQTFSDWLKRNLKKASLLLLMLLAVGQGLYFFLRHFPDTWWILATVSWLLLTIVLGKIAPVLIIPLFYKCRPMTNELLKERLLKLSRKCSVKIKQVFEIRLSKDTQKANAGVAGFGKARRILLADTLLKNYSDGEIEAVFAHELGHICLSHIWKILLFGTFVSVVSFYLTYILFEAASAFFAFDGIADIAAFPLLTLILMILGLILLPLQNAFLRSLEKKADIFAIENIQNPESFTSAMEKLAQQNLSDPEPHKWEEILLYDHPPVSKRLHYTTQKNEK